MNSSAQSVEPKTSSRKYTRRSEAQWRELIENFERSDLTLEAYCQHHKIAASGFYAWRKRFEIEIGKERQEETLIDITPQLSDTPSLAQAHNTAWQVEVELGRGCILRIKSA